MYIDMNGGSYERLFNEDLIELGLARATALAHTYTLAAARSSAPGRNPKRGAQSSEVPFPTSPSS
ncbi:MAG: hypothetical protein M3464_02320 [Chloroflexota bacterium]|nr:hypothetical protein [Chloroflexota bacterium]